MRLGRVLAVVLLMGALVLLPGAPARANFNEQGCVTGQSGPACPADNRDHRFYYDALGPRLMAATEATRTQSYKNVNGWTTSVTTVHANADVHYFYDNTLPGAQIGLYKCTIWFSDGRCDHAHIRYDRDAIIAFGLSDDDLQSLACHETGHSVGLTHSADDGQPDDPSIFHCMVEATFPRFLGPHNVWHLETEGVYW